MPYISNPVYCGVGVVDDENALALAKDAEFRDTYALAFKAISRMTSTQIQSVIARTLNAVPANERAAHMQMAVQAAKTLDPRVTPGLGVLSTIETVAVAAGIVASVAATGLAIWQFVETKKQNKDQKAAQDAQSALVNQQLNLEIQAKKQQMSAQQTQAQLDAQGLKLDSQGNPIPKTSAGSLMAAITAAGAGAFFLMKK